MQRTIIITVEQSQNPVVKRDDLPAFPVTFVVATADADIIGHIDADCAQNMCAQGCSASMHPEYHGNRPTLACTRIVRDPGRRNRLPRQGMGCCQIVIHSRLENWWINHNLANMRYRTLASSLSRGSPQSMPVPIGQRLKRSAP